jgi:hypothetical protein
MQLDYLFGGGDPANIGAHGPGGRVKNLLVAAEITIASFDFSGWKLM